MKRTCPFAILITALAMTAQPAVAAEQTVIHTFHLPEFATTDNFIFRTQHDLQVPAFNTQHDRLYLVHADFRVLYSSGVTYTVTNHGKVFGFGRVKSEPGVTGIGPSGQLFGPPFGHIVSGPGLNPGQSGVAITGGYNGGKGRGFGAALPFTGDGHYTIAFDIVQTHSIVEPDQFSAVYNGGSVTPPQVTVTYTYRCLGDTNSDGVINVSDLLDVINHWGQIGFCPNSSPTPNPFYPCRQDHSPPWGDGVVNLDDLLTVISNWGICPTP